MQKSIKIISYFLFLLTFLFIFVGCGHNMTTASKGIGIDISWSGNGYIPNLRLGYWDTTQTTVRGNTTFSQTTTTGGSLLGAGGTSQTIQMSSGPQLNEGNIVEVVNGNASDEVKRAVVEAAMRKNAPPQNPSSAKTISAAAGTGSNPPQVEPSTTGVDKVVDTVGDVANTAIPAVQDVANTTVNKVGDVADTAILSTKWVIIIAGVVAIFLIIIGVVVYLKYFRKKKEVAIEENSNENITVLNEEQLIESSSSNNTIETTQNFDNQ